MYREPAPLLPPATVEGVTGLRPYTVFSTMPIELSFAASRAGLAPYRREIPLRTGQGRPMPERSENRVAETAPGAYGGCPRASSACADPTFAAVGTAAADYRKRDRLPGFRGPDGSSMPLLPVLHGRVAVPEMRCERPCAHREGADGRQATLFSLFELTESGIHEAGLPDQRADCRIVLCGESPRSSCCHRSTCREKGMCGVDMEAWRSWHAQQHHRLEPACPSRHRQFVTLANRLTIGWLTTNVAPASGGGRDQSISTASTGEACH